jgi:hypothetical protein
MGEGTLYMLRYYIMLLPLGFIFAEIIAKRNMYNVPSPIGCVRVRIGTIPALIVEGDERGPWDGSTWATTFDCYVG